jgi:hypothetical protein
MENAFLAVKHMDLAAKLVIVRNASLVSIIPLFIGMANVLKTVKINHFTSIMELAFLVILTNIMDVVVKFVTSSNV